MKKTLREIVLVHAAIATGRAVLGTQYGTIHIACEGEPIKMGLYKYKTVCRPKSTIKSLLIADYEKFIGDSRVCFFCTKRLVSGNEKIIRPDPRNNCRPYDKRLQEQLDAVRSAPDRFSRLVAISRIKFNPPS